MIATQHFFRIELIADHPEWEAFINEFKRMFLADNQDIRKSNIPRRLVGIILLNLLVSDMERDGGVIISRSEQYYVDLAKKDRRWKETLTYTHSIVVQNWFIDNGYVELYRGSSYKHLRSELWVTEKLRKAMVDIMKPTYKTVTFDVDLFDSVKIKDMTLKETSRNAKIIKSSNETTKDSNGRLMFANIKAIPLAMIYTHKNTCNIKHNTPLYSKERIKDDCSIISTPNSYGLDIGKSIIQRIFSKSNTLEYGGRFYAIPITGFSYQNITAVERSTIEIDCEPTVEIDYSALHPSMLYSMADKIELKPKDMYKVKVDGNPAPRKLCKVMLLTMINAKSEQSAIKSMRHEMRFKAQDEWMEHEAWAELLKPLVGALKELHRHISHYFFTDIGIKLQRKDSDMAQYVMNFFNKHSWACLPIHDSFIVKRKHEHDLFSIMLDAEIAIMGCEFSLPEVKKIAVADIKKAKTKRKKSRRDNKGIVFFGDVPQV